MRYRSQPPSSNGVASAASELRVVVSKDGFIDCAWGSKRLFKSGIYYRARQETVPLPELSLAARRDPPIDAEIGFVHPKGVWVGNEVVNEMTVFAGKSDLAITLLLYPNDANYLRLMPEHDGRYCDEQNNVQLDKLGRLLRPLRYRHPRPHQEP